mmetsp:Transcript_2447/g.6270  ORF Transcript_2447/g.6270 Transcript_2447/m.6270 type:complete len:253 (+) Transcript_2447:160-918(+)
MLQSPRPGKWSGHWSSGGCWRGSRPHAAGAGQEGLSCSVRAAERSGAAQSVSLVAPARERGPEAASRQLAVPRVRRRGASTRQLHRARPRRAARGVGAGGWHAARSQGPSRQHEAYGERQRPQRRHRICGHRRAAGGRGDGAAAAAQDCRRHHQQPEGGGGRAAGGSRVCQADQEARGSWHPHQLCARRLSQGPLRAALLHLHVVCRRPPTPGRPAPGPLPARTARAPPEQPARAEPQQCSAPRQRSQWCVP